MDIFAPNPSTKSYEPLACRLFFSALLFANLAFAAAALSAGNAEPLTEPIVPVLLPALPVKRLAERPTVAMDGFE